jgi:diguanylate cyclase (GGDEF)-like protein
MGWFATALGLELAHAVLASFRGIIPRWAGIVLPNQLHTLSCFAVFMGFRWFVVRRTMGRAFPTVLMLASMGLYSVLALRKSPYAFASSMAPVLLLDAMTILLLLRGTGIFRSAARTSAALLSVEFGIACYRTILITLIYPSSPPAMTDPRWLFTMFALMVLDTAIVLVFVWFLIVETQHRLRDFARRDPLTGLLNRRAFDGEFTREFSRARRFRSPLALITLDIDHFKSINDRFGHAAGDKALASVGELLRSDIRQMDVPVRFGGDEFALLLPETDRHGATALAEKLLRRLMEQRLSTPGGILHMTFTAGVAELDDSDSGWESLLERADANLYVGKLGGRNRVASSGSLDRLPDHRSAELVQNA